ncbi:twin-arginine translocation signal domain-containing protein [Streptomyces rubradiris]|uniref:twin-arginine translocation signal domain-containing protein n=1 Tax=Streptomyces rubradiris TaxID=285531 RepID=UPI0033EA235D
MQSRRTFLRGSMTATAAALLGPAALTACSSGSTPPSAKNAGILRYGAAVEPDSWDPHAASTTVTGRLLRPVLESLAGVLARSSGKVAVVTARPEEWLPHTGLETLVVRAADGEEGTYSPNSTRIRPRGVDSSGK